MSLEPPTPDLENAASRLGAATYERVQFERSADIAIVGGGIVGLATALALQATHPNERIVVLEKEAGVGLHQTGHNSGVIHSGIYYKPKSLKATLCRAGARSMVEFCAKYGIAHDVCGKIIVATHEDELPQLEMLYRRGLENGLEVKSLSAEEAREKEPHVAALKAIWVPSTGICDYGAVARTYAKLVRERGAAIALSTRVLRIAPRPREHILETNQGALRARFVINCAGLYSDRIAKESGAEPGAQIVPFRGEYYELVPKKRHLVKNLIYPVPNPDFPFLGVHFTRMIDGSVHAGPNAVLGLCREGYEKSAFDGPELFEILGYRGLWQLAKKNWREGAREAWRSISKAAFVASLQRLIPDVRSEDVVPTHAGVRAQALKPDGTMVDDFLIVEGQRALHVCNAPSPAATSSLEIGRTVAQRVRARMS